MKSRIMLFLLTFLSLIILAACTKLPQTASPSLTPSEIVSSTAVPTHPAVTETATRTPIPTATPTPAPTATPNVAYDPQAKADRVTFAPYATWVELDSSVTPNSARRFVLSAMQYQTMSVSVRQGPPFTVEVAGADKQTLTDPQNPQFYWRGGLPSTQDYYITVTSQEGGPFTLRVAINPPGLANQYFEYIDPQYHVVLDYSDEFAPTNWQLPFTTKGTPLVSLYFIEPSYYYPTTNLIEAGLVLTASADPGIVESCTQPAAGLNETVTGDVSVNGYTFRRSEFAGVAAGNEYDQVFYRTVAQGKCFEVIYLIHSGNIGNYSPGTVVEFDMERLLHQFETVLDTFNIK